MSKQFEDVMAMGEARGRAEGEARGRAEGEARGRAEGEARGRAEGEARGRAEGEAKGEARGRAEGEAREKERSVLSVLGNGVSEEETARLLSLALDEVREIAGRQKTAGASM